MVGYLEKQVRWTDNQDVTQNGAENGVKLQKTKTVVTQDAEIKDTTRFFILILFPKFLFFHIYIPFSLTLELHLMSTAIQPILLNLSLYLWDLVISLHNSRIAVVEVFNHTSGIALVQHIFETISSDNKFRAITRTYWSSVLIFIKLLSEKLRKFKLKLKISYAYNLLSTIHWCIFQRLSCSILFANAK